MHRQTGREVVVLLFVYIYMCSSWRPTYDTEGFPGEAEAALPASVAAAAARTPYPDDVLQTEHYNHHKLLQDTHTHNKKTYLSGKNAEAQAVKRAVAKAHLLNLNFLCFDSLRCLLWKSNLVI